MGTKTGKADSPSSEDFARSIWSRYLEIAEQYNDPGRFTTIIGYEWTSTPGGDNLHRNVLYRNSADMARQMLPYTAMDSMNPEDLWKWMTAYEEKTGGLAGRRIAGAADRQGGFSAGCEYTLISRGRHIGICRPEVAAVACCRNGFGSRHAPRSSQWFSNRTGRRWGSFADGYCNGRLHAGGHRSRARRIAACSLGTSGGSGCRQLDRRHRSVDVGLGVPGVN